MSGFTLRSLDGKCCSKHKTWCEHSAASSPAWRNVLVSFSVALKGTCTAGGVNVGKIFNLQLSKQSLVFSILLYQSPYHGLDHPVILN